MRGEYFGGRLLSLVKRLEAVILFNLTEDTDGYFVLVEKYMKLFFVLRERFHIMFMQ